MPFGHDCEYATFQDCVNRNKDKEDPEAYCATIQRQTEEHCKNRNRGLNILPTTSASRDLFRDRARNFIRNFLQTGEKTETRDWFKITNRKDDDGNDISEVFIFDEIGAWGTSADDFVKALNDIDSGQIDVRINSPGGEVYDGIAIHNALKFHDAKVTAYVEALAASAASFIAMAADEIVMISNSEMMIHDAAGCCAGNATEMRGTANDLDRVSDNIASIYAERAGSSASFWRSLMKEETWFSAEEAVEAGLADRVKKKAPKETEEESKEELEISNHWNLSIFKFQNRASAPNPLSRLKPSAKLADTIPDKPESEPTPEESTVDDDLDIIIDFKSALDSVVDPLPPINPEDFKAITENIVYSVPAESTTDEPEEETEDGPDFSDLKDIVRKVTR